MPDPTRTGTLEKQQEANEEEEIEKLEEEVREMANKLRRYRSTVAEEFKSRLASLLVAQRPVLGLPVDGSEAGSSREGDPGSSAGSSDASSTYGDQESAEKLRLLKEKISSNISAMPITLKRMRDCISRIDKLDSCNVAVPPPFKRKKR